MSLLSLYHHLPYPLRCGVASARGHYLNFWRYGDDTDRHVDDILSRETWSAAQWRAWQEEELARLLHGAAKTVPWYRDHWDRRRRNGDRSAIDQLRNWPILEKEDLRQHPRAFLSDSCAPRRMFHVHTSGTSGKPVHIWQSRATVQRQYALMEARWRRWYGLSRHDRWAIIGGQLVAPVRQKAPPYWVWNAGLHQLYMSSYHLSMETAPHYHAALLRNGIRYVWGYSSSLHTLAEGFAAHGLPSPGVAAVITNAEPLLAHQREAIERAFDCPVIETYGMSEAVASASQCEHGRMHLWPESGVLEVLDAGNPVPAGQPGDFVATGLNNVDMPLIRYRTGDRGALADDREPCPCGRSLPRLASVEGRLDDVLYSPDGRRIGRLDPVFKADLPLREAQIVQETLTSLRVRCVPAPGWNAATERTIAQRLRERMGEVDVSFDLVPSIPRGANGKFRAVLCQLSEEQKRRVLREAPREAPSPALNPAAP